MFCTRPLTGTRDAKLALLKGEEKREGLARPDVHLPGGIGPLGENQYPGVDVLIGESSTAMSLAAAASTACRLLA